MKKLFAFCLLASFAVATSAFATAQLINGETVGKAIFTPDCSGYTLNSCTAKATCKSCTANGKTKYRIISCAKGYEIQSNGCKRCVPPTSKGWSNSCPSAAVCEVWNCGGMKPRFLVKACKSGYEDVNGNCVPTCKANEIRSNGKCICKPGYELVNGNCVQTSKANEIRSKK